MRTRAQALLAGALPSEAEKTYSSSSKKAFLSALLLSSQPRFSRLASAAASWAATISESPCGRLHAKASTNRWHGANRPV